MKRILYISHNASRSGAPLFLLQLATWLKINHQIEPCFLLIDGGEMEQEFKNTGTVWYLNAYHTQANLKERFVGKLKKSLKQKYYRLRILNEIKDQHFNLVYANTIVTTHFVDDLKKIIEAPFVLHIHEMLFSIKHYYPEYFTKELLKNFNHLIVVNSIIKKFVAPEIDGENIKISVIPPFLLKKLAGNNCFEKKTKTFTVGISGYGGWRKGLDLIVPLMAKIYYQYNLIDIKFFWLGHVDDELKSKIQFELLNINSNLSLIFTGSVNNVNDYYAQFDLFLLLSKEDPFPIAAIEAAAAGLPIIGFENSGGISEIINNTGGYLVPFLDLDKMAEKIVFLKDNPTVKERLSLCAKKNAANYTIDIIGAKIFDVLSHYIN